MIEHAMGVSGAVRGIILQQKLSKNYFERIVSFALQHRKGLL